MSMKSCLLSYSEYAMIKMIKKTSWKSCDLINIHVHCQKGCGVDLNMCIILEHTIETYSLIQHSPTFIQYQMTLALILSMHIALKCFGENCYRVTYSTMCPRSSDPFYVVTNKYKMGYYFLDI